MVDWKKVAIAGVTGAVVGFATFQINNEGKLAGVVNVCCGDLFDTPEASEVAVGRAMAFGLLGATIAAIVT